MTKSKIAGTSLSTLGGKPTIAHGEPSSAHQGDDNERSFIIDLTKVFGREEIALPDPPAYTVTVEGLRASDYMSVTWVLPVEYRDILFDLIDEEDPSVEHAIKLHADMVSRFVHLAQVPPLKGWPKKDTYALKWAVWELANTADRCAKGTPVAPPDLLVMKVYVPGSSALMEVFIFVRKDYLDAPPSITLRQAMIVAAWNNGSADWSQRAAGDPKTS